MLSRQAVWVGGGKPTEGGCIVPSKSCKSSASNWQLPPESILGNGTSLGRHWRA